MADEILKSDLGFSNLEFSKKIEGTFNIEFYGNGIAMMLTDLGDDVRIFIPNSDFVFYENGEILMTNDDFQSSRIDVAEASTYYFMAKEIIPY